MNNSRLCPHIHFVIQNGDIFCKVLSKQEVVIFLGGHNESFKIINVSCI